MLASACVIVPLILWVGLWLAPWRPWSTREHLENNAGAAEDLSGVTVLIPARNEAGGLGRTLAALTRQGAGLSIVVIDDQSTDGTAQVASSFPGVTVVPGQALPPGWAGKLWALEQGRQHVRTPLVLLLDADIELAPGMLATLLLHKREVQCQFVSLMADLCRHGFWDRLLLPVFVYYFKLLYPFGLSNSRSRLVAAGAGGCILVDAAMLERVGAFASLRDALIDDCTLARQVKRAEGRTWIGLSRDAISTRPYGSYRSIHRMVARSAFTQLGYSALALLGVTALFLLAYGAPLAMLTVGWARPWALLTLSAMMLSYVPLLRYYRLSPAWALLLPVSAGCFLVMTWSSAVACWRGVRSQWKGRTYGAGAR